MGHGLPNMIGVNTAGLDAQIQKLLPAYMSMGQAGMADMGDMSMPAPDNSVAAVVPQGTRADVVSAADLARDGVIVG